MSPYERVRIRHLTWALAIHSTDHRGAIHTRFLTRTHIYMHVCHLYIIVYVYNVIYIYIYIYSPRNNHITNSSIMCNYLAYYEISDWILTDDDSVGFLAFRTHRMCRKPLGIVTGSPVHIFWPKSVAPLECLAEFSYPLVNVYIAMENHHF